MSIIKKTTSKVKDFFHKSKKMFEPPKELPALSPPKVPSRDSVPPALQDPGNLIIRTQTPPHEARRAPPLLKLPTIEAPRQHEPAAVPAKEDFITIEEMSSFDEAIKSIHSDIMKITDHTPQQQEARDERPTQAAAPSSEKEDYYAPRNLGEGYFSEIRHYIKNKDVKEIIDDVIAKDFLTGMKDYHDQKSQGKPYYLHSQDLKEKLERQMHELMEREESWHELKAQMAENERRKATLEKEIDQEGEELKELFRLIKTNQILEKEAGADQQFGLRNGQKLKSLNDLRKALGYMSDDDFSFHANDSKNDFAEWARHALRMPDMAEKIRQAKTKDELSAALKSPL